MNAMRTTFSTGRAAAAVVLALAALFLSPPSLASERSQSPQPSPFRIIVKTSGGSPEFADAVKRESERLMAGISEFIGHKPTAPVFVFIAKNDKEFEEYTGGRAPAWAIAVYIKDERAVVMRAESFSSDTGYFLSVLQHELVHAALEHKFRAQPRALPRWLNEGLAVYVSDAWESPESWFKRRADLYNAVRKGSALDFDDLHYGFPSGKFIAELAYAQSHDFVSWLIKKRGEAGMRRLLSELAAGTERDAAFSAVYGDTLEGLAADWLAQSAKPAAFVWVLQFFAAFDTYIWTAMSLLVLVAGLKVFLGFRRKKKFTLVYPPAYDPDDDWDELDEEWDIDDYGHRPWRPGRKN